MMNINHLLTPSQNPVNIMDCTFRDGGYYNNWLFDEDLVHHHLDVISALPIQAVEVGFRKFKEAITKECGRCGELAYTTEDYLNKLNVPKNLKIALMIESKDLKNYDLAQQKSYLIPKAQSKADIIRFSSHFGEFENFSYFLNYAADLGYAPSLNLISIGVFSLKEIKEKIHFAKNLPVFVVYIPDTLGSMDPKHLTNIIDIFQSELDCDLGFHAHDNRGFALINALTAIDHGVKWIDATVCGMGRGAGNLKLETILIELASKYNLDSDLSPLFDLVEKRYEELHKMYPWGENLYYHTASLKKIHPTNLQKLLENPVASSAEKLKEIDRLALI